MYTQFTLSSMCVFLIPMQSQGAGFVSFVQEELNSKSCSVFVIRIFRIFEYSNTCIIILSPNPTSSENRTGNKSDVIPMCGTCVVSYICHQRPFCCADHLNQAWSVSSMYNTCACQVCRPKTESKTMTPLCPTDPHNFLLQDIGVSFRYDLCPLPTFVE